MLFRKLVKSRSVGIEQRRHLVDKRARTACASAVHTLFKTARYVSDFSVFAAEFDSDVRLRNKSLDSVRSRGYFLNKRDLQPLRHGNAARTRYSDKNAFSCEFLSDFSDNIRHGFSYVREMPLITAEQQFVILTHNRRFYGG